MSLSKEQKKQLFLQNMGIAEANDADQYAGGRYHRNRHPVRQYPTSYNNMSGGDSMHTNEPNLRTVGFTISNTGTEVQNAVLFGQAFAPASGANITITPKNGVSIGSINSDAATNPFRIHEVLYNGRTEDQMDHSWKLQFSDNSGSNQGDVFHPQDHVDPRNLKTTLIRAPFPKFTASNKDWLVIPVEPGATITINFWVGAQLSSAGIVEGTHTVV